MSRLYYWQILHFRGHSRFNIISLSVSDLTQKKVSVDCKLNLYIYSTVLTMQNLSMRTAGLSSSVVRTAESSYSVLCSS